MKWLKLALVFFITHSASAISSDVPSVFFLESTGNNQHEAKIAALHDGMRRAFLIFAEKSGIKLRQGEEPSYQELRSCVVAEKIVGEKAKPNFYQGNAKIICLPHAALELLLKFAQDPKQVARLKSSIKAPPLQPLIAVVPILKKNRAYMSHGTDWHKSWSRHSALLTQSQVLLLEGAKAQNSFAYKDLQQSFPNAPDLIVIACAELFTNYEGLFSCKIEYRVLSENGAQEIKRKTSYESNADFVMDESVKSFCLNDAPALKPKTKPLKPREILLEIYRRDVQNLDSTMTSISSLGSIKLKTHKPGLHIVHVSTTLDDYLLAEQLYIKGLGYLKNKARYRVLQLYR
jgi:hypothetical protein